MKKKLILFCVATFGIIFLSIFLFESYNIKPPSYYYGLIKNQEKIKSDVKINDEDKKDLEECKTKDRQDECFRKFYDNYTTKNGVENAFSHLALVQLTYPDLLSGCHYLSHGIGHSSLRQNNGELYKTFSVMQDSNYFKNVATCGNGYFHGVMEEYAKNTKTKEGLVKLLNGVCEDKKITSKSACFHGIGHAAAASLENNLDESLYVCDNISKNEVNLFSCRTGAFMETIHQFSVSVEDGVMNFDTCDSKEEKYRSACYMEHASLFERYTNEPKNYTRNIGFCKQIEDMVNRMACIKLNAIRATRIVRYEEIKEMCGNTSSRQESRFCFSIFASRISGSMALKNTDPLKNKTVRDICSIAGPVEKYYCLDILQNHGLQLFFTSEKDLKESTLDFNFMYERFKKDYNLSILTI